MTAHCPLKKNYGKDIKNRSSESKTEVQSARLQPLQTLWPSAGLHSQVRRLPHLLPPAGARRADSGGDQIELVSVGGTPPVLARIKLIMNISDPITDMLTRIRNAIGARHS